MPYLCSLSSAIAKLAQTTANGGAGISFSATAPGRATVVINSEDEISFSIADGAGRTLRSIDQLGIVTTMTYDPAGNQLSIRDPNNVGADMVYNARGNKLTETYPDHTSGSPGDSTYGIVTFVYDNAGRVLRKQDQLGDTVTYTYDPIGRKATESLAIASRTYTTTSEYNSRGELIKVTYPDSSISERTYHDTGALTS